MYLNGSHKYSAKMTSGMRLQKADNSRATPVTDDDNKTGDYILVL